MVTHWVRSAGRTAKGKAGAKAPELAKFSTAVYSKNLTGRVFCLYFVFVREAFTLSGAAPACFGSFELEGKYLRSRNNKTEWDRERPEWGPAPPKPSKPLRTEAKRVVLLLECVRISAGCISGSQ